MRTHLVWLGLLLAACSGGGGGGITNPPAGGTPTGGSGNIVQATTGLQFTPPSVSISTGGEVVWQFSSVTHTVTFAQPGSNPTDYGGDVSTTTPPDDIPATTNQSVTRTFPVAGTFRYRCTIHPNMIGTVVVR